VPHSRARRLAGPIVLICAFLAVIVVIVVAVLSSGGSSRPSRAEPRFDYPVLEVAPGSAVPYPGGAVAAEKLAQRTDIPERTMRAYLIAEAAMAQRAPNCKLTWATLAGVGRVESRHGRTGGSAVGSDGRLSPPVIGIALDGSAGVRAIRDTDRGALDGDTAWDRAVGAMQFLPATWSRWATRASADGAPPDPQDVDDAALTAARYLCASGGNLSTGKGWWKAVMTYNESVTYARDVFSAADAYARSAATPD
jgi:membrane-bound lytic murein transglycosylase B